MRILIVMPRFSNSVLQSYEIPLGILYISSALKSAGKEVHTLNLNCLEGTVEDEIAKAIKEVDPDVCASGGLSDNFQIVQSVFVNARKYKPEIINIAGGGLVSADPEMAAKLCDFDIGVRGEGELAIVEVIDALSNNLPLQDVTGLVIKRDKEPPLLTQARKVNFDISTLPWPDYEGFNMDKLLEIQIPQNLYIFHPYDNPRSIPMITSRSCPLQCTFCYHPTGQVYRERDFDDFFAELDHLIATYNINLISISDDLLSLKKRRMIEFCERIKPYNLKWECQIHEKSVDIETLNLLKEAGCFAISIGIESMSEPILNSMKKRTSPEKLAKALKLIYSSDLLIQGNILLGDPADTLETIAESFNFMVQHPEYGINYSRLRVLPGSEIYKNAEQKGLFGDQGVVFANPEIQVNLTHMTNEVFNSLCMRFNFYTKTLIYKGSVLSIDLEKEAHPIFGKGKTCQWLCPKCNKISKYGSIFIDKGNIRLSCRHCYALAYIHIWSFNPPLSNPKEDIQLAIAQKHEEIYLHNNSTQAKQNAAIEYHKLLTNHCLPPNNTNKSWACDKAALKLGQFKLENGEQEEAMQLIMYALENNVWNPDSHATFAIALKKEGSLGAALLYLDKAIELSNDPPQSWINSREELDSLIDEKGLRNNNSVLYFNSFY
ncbi:MAG: B12-binding domain-containing radical SAM protein [Magnetococcales bacterium]|nr:B12-binding domain-containing radical SAM protein [Magnetococcales bacterium]